MCDSCRIRRDDISPWGIPLKVGNGNRRSDSEFTIFNLLIRLSKVEQLVFKTLHPVVCRWLNNWPQYRASPSFAFHTVVCRWLNNWPQYWAPIPFVSRVINLLVFGKVPSRASCVFERTTALKPAFRECFTNASSKRGLRSNFFQPHRAYIAFKALDRCETQAFFSWQRHCQLRMYCSNFGLTCLHKRPVDSKVSGIHFLMLFQEESAFCVPAILLALHGLRFNFLVNS